MKQIIVFIYLFSLLAFASCKKSSDTPEPEPIYHAPKMPYSEFMGYYKSVGVKINGIDATSYYSVIFSVQLDSATDQIGRAISYTLPAFFFTQETRSSFGTVVRDNIKSPFYRLITQGMFGDKVFEMGDFYSYSRNCRSTDYGHFCDTGTEFIPSASFRYEKNADNSFTFTRLVGGIKHEYLLLKQ